MLAAQRHRGPGWQMVDVEARPSGGAPLPGYAGAPPDLWLRAGGGKAVGIQGARCPVS